MKKFVFIIVIIAGITICISFMACSEGNLQDSPQDSTQNPSTVKAADLLPVSGEISPWTCGSYQEANDFTSLYAIIDGDAQTYVNYGFVEGVVQEYEGGNVGGQPATVGLWIFDQGNASSAQALLADPVIIPAIFTPYTIGDEAYLDDALYYVAIHLRDDRFYVKVSVDKNGDLEQAQSIVLLFANNVISGIN